MSQLNAEVMVRAFHYNGIRIPAAPEFVHSIDVKSAMSLIPEATVFGGQHLERI